MSALADEVPTYRHLRFAKQLKTLDDSVRLSRVGCDRRFELADGLLLNPNRKLHLEHNFPAGTRD